MSPPLPLTWHSEGIPILRTTTIQTPPYCHARYLADISYATYAILSTQIELPRQIHLFFTKRSFPSPALKPSEVFFSIAVFLNTLFHFSSNSPHFLFSQLNGKPFNGRDERFDVHPRYFVFNSRSRDLRSRSLDVFSNTSRFQNSFSAKSTQKENFKQKFRFLQGSGWICGIST